MICKKCAAKINDGQLLCYNCGETQKLPEFSDVNTRDEFLAKLLQLSKAVTTNTLSTDYMWDATVEKYAKTIELTKSVLSTEIMADKVTAKMFRDMDNMLKRCKSAEFHIALVGAINAGKSTLINALLGIELASTSVTPETAVLTKFRSSKQNYIKISFYSTTEWDKLWTSANNSKAEVFLEEYRFLNAESQKNQYLDKVPQIIDDFNGCDTLKEEIENLTSSKKPAHYFIREVEVGLKDFHLPPEVILVDTPGLDDVVQYRSDITRDYIDRANAVLVCVKSDVLRGQEMQTICNVFANTRYKPEKVYIVATQLDTLNRPLENWKLQSEDWLKHLKRRPCFGSEELAIKNLIPVSGYVYTLIKNFGNISKSDDRYYDLASVLLKFRINIEDLGEHHKQLLDFTGIDYLKSKIDREVVVDYKTILLEDIRENFLLCKDEISELMRKIKVNQQEVLDTSEKGIEEIRKKRDEYVKKLEETATEKEGLDVLIKTVRRDTTKRMKELIDTIKNMGGI